MTKLAIGLLFITFFLFSCENKGGNDEILVQVFDEVLTKSELYQQLDDALTEEDSTRLAQGILETWVKNKMLVAQAERNLTDSLKDFTKELEQEKNNLLIYAYQNEFIKQNLDTAISQSEIVEYYNSNKNSFILSDYILRYNFLKIASSAENLDKYKIKKLLSSPLTEINHLKSYSSEIGATFHFSSDSTEWWYLREFLDIVPVEVYNNESFLKNQKFIDFESENFRYFVYISEYKLKDEPAPLNVVIEKIKTLILNRRKQSALKQLKIDLYQKAVRENKIKYFE